MLKLADEGLSLATALPGALGATNTGPKTYLLLAQNEDELRPTGGFITSAGKLVLQNGRVIGLEFEGVDNDVQEDWTRPYPAAPWQLQEYMNSPVLIFRDFELVQRLPHLGAVGRILICLYPCPFGGWSHRLRPAVPGHLAGRAWAAGGGGRALSAHT